MVLAIRENNTLTANPSGAMTLAPGQMLVVMGVNSSWRNCGASWGMASMPWKP